MDVTVGLVFAFMFLISYFILTKPKNYPPGPLGLPIIGSAFMLNKFRRQRPHKVLLDAAKQYGDVMSFRVGRKLFVVLTGYDVVHEALVNQADVFSDRPENRPSAVSQDTNEIKAYAGNAGVLTQNYGSQWRMLRRFTLQSLRDFGVGKTSLEEKIFTEIEVVSKAFQDSEGRPIDASNYTQKLVGNVLFGIVFGKRYDYGDPEYARIRSMLTRIVSGTGVFSAGRLLPSFLAKFVNRKDAETDAAKKASFAEVRKYITDEIKEHEATFDGDNIRDFVDIYLQTKQENSTEKDTIDIVNMFRVIMDLFIAGSETTFTTLDWALLYMSEFPEIQAKCQKEIQETFGDKPVQYSDRGMMPYLEATLQEIQRKANIVPLSVPHSTTSDATLRGYHIPAGTTIIPNLYSVNNDPRNWKQPEKFQPERFLSESGKLVKNEAFMPFSTGPRVCLGEPLAKMELFLVFTNLLQRFTFKREDNSIRHSMEAKQYQITNAPASYKLRVYKRN